MAAPTTGKGRRIIGPSRDKMAADLKFPVKSFCSAR
jgi:hypothetical protein